MHSIAYSLSEARDGDVLNTAAYAYHAYGPEFNHKFKQHKNIETNKNSTGTISARNNRQMKNSPFQKQRQADTIISNKQAILKIRHL